MDATVTARLRWRCRRGIKEMDLLLQGFLERQYPMLDAREQAAFQALLDEADLDIYAWITSQAIPENADYLSIINPLRKVMSRSPGLPAAGSAGMSRQMTR